MSYRWSLKLSEGGAGGVPVPHFSAMPLCQASKYDLNVPNRPCLSTCKHRVVGVPDGSCSLGRGCIEDVEGGA